MTEAARGEEKVKIVKQQRWTEERKCVKKLSLKRAYKCFFHDIMQSQTDTQTLFTHPALK